MSRSSEIESPGLCVKIVCCCLYPRSPDQERILNATGFILRGPERVSRYPQILNSLTEKRLSYIEVRYTYSNIDKIYSH
ncbi:MAG: hypothetical protein ACM3SR_17455 [Ignavibacteriales bacterium]